MKGRTNKRANVTILSEGGEESGELFSMCDDFLLLDRKKERRKERKNERKNERKKERQTERKSPCLSEGSEEDTLVHL